MFTAPSPLANRDFRAVLAITFVVMLGFGIIAPVLPLYARSFGVSYAAVGLLISGFGFVRLLSQPPGGVLVDRLGERTVAVTGVLIVGVSSAAAGAAPNFPLLLVFRCLGGIGSAWFISSLYAYVLTLVDRSAAGRALSLYQASFTAGITMGPVAGGLIAARFGLRAPFFAYGIFCGISAIIAFFRMKPHHGRAPAVVEGGWLSSLRHVPRDRVYLLALAANVALWWTIFGTRITLMPLFAADRLDASEAWIGGVVTASSVASLIVLAHAGRMADRSRIATMIFGMTGTAAFTASLGFLDVRTLFIGAFAVLGALQGYARVPVVALVADVVDESNRGRAIAVHQMAGDLGGILGPVAAGLLAARAGFAPAFALMAIPAALVVIPALWARPPRPRATPPPLPATGAP